MTNGILPPLLHDLFQTKPSRSPEITNHKVPRGVLPIITSPPPRDVPSHITGPTPHREVPRVRIPPTSTRRSMRTSKPTQHSDYIYANATVELSPAEEEVAQDNFCQINAVLDPSTTGKMQEYRDLIKTKDKELWQDGAYKELARLAQGHKKGDVHATNTIQFIPHTELPKHNWTSAPRSSYRQPARTPTYGTPPKTVLLKKLRYFSQTTGIFA